MSSKEQTNTQNTGVISSIFRGWFSGRSWLRAVVITAVILSVLIFFLPSLLKTVLNSAAPWGMEKAGLTDTVFEIKHFSWRRFETGNITFRSEDQNAEVSLKKLSWHFSPFSLIKGDAGTLTIKSLHVKAEVSAANTTEVSEDSRESSDPATLTDAKTLFSYIPFERAEIEQFSLIHPQINLQGKLFINKRMIQLKQKAETPWLTSALNMQLNIKDTGELSLGATPESDDAPVFLLQGEWKARSENKGFELNLQQTTDLQRLLSLIKSGDDKPKLKADTAIQAWRLSLELPPVLDFSQLLAQNIKGNGELQFIASDFTLYPSAKATEALIEQADLNISISTLITSESDTAAFRLIAETLHLNGIARLKDIPPLTLKTFADQPVTVECRIDECHWTGKITQKINAKQLSASLGMALSGEMQNQRITGQQQISGNVDQKNPLWPSAEITFTGTTELTTDISSQEWTLSLPKGIHGTFIYPDIPTGQLLPLKWSLLSAWKTEGIASRITESTPVTGNISGIEWKDGKKASQLKHLKITDVDFECDFDWLVLQYEQNQKDRNRLLELPLECNWGMITQPGKWEKWPLPAMSMSGNLNLTYPTLRTEIGLKGLNQKLDLTLNAQHRFADKKQTLSKGSAQLYLNNLKLDWQDLGLSEMESLTEVNLLDGALSAQGWMHWEQYQEDVFDDESVVWRWQPDVMLRVDDVAGSFRDTTTWEDVDFQMALRRPFYGQYRIDTQASALQVNTGIAIENILARSTTTIEPDFSKALVVVNEVHTDVLGGQIKVPLIRFDTSEKVNAFGIEVNGISMEELAKLEANAGVNATGKLDGVLPIVLLPEGPQIPAGTLYARAPGGVIQYRGSAADTLRKSDQTVGLAIQLLDDFRYDQLETHVNYEPDGALKLGLQFQGHNPGFFDGQATHLNLNLDYNLLDLLESLRISNDIVETLEKKYQ